MHGARFISIVDCEYQMSKNADSECSCATVKRRRVTGVIVRRRCLGSSLAFADVKCDTDDEVISVVFRASSFISTDENIFPRTKTALPFGAKVDMWLVESFQVNGPRWQVVKWNILRDPKADAQEVARQEEGGMLLTEYLKDRCNTFMNLQDSTIEMNRQARRINKETTCDKSCPECGGNHGRNKALRAKIFSRWLQEKMNISSTDKVLDIAGGKGLLSMELARSVRSQCTVIDPLIRKKPNMKHLQMLQAPLPEFVTDSFFNNEETVASEMVSSSTVLVGLHPDECTEDILDVALKCNKSVAIVPCCVFPRLFPDRKLGNGRSVVSYHDFLSFLLEKDARLRQAELAIDGKNQVIYLNA